MALTSRLALSGPSTEDPEDFLSTSLGVIFPDDVTNQHGDDDHGLVYTSPHLPKPLHIALADVKAEDDRRLFSHYLWNASLLLAELVEAGTLGLPDPAPAQRDGSSPHLGLPVAHFNVKGFSTAELGAGTALPSTMASLLGARRVLVTDYPSDPVLATLRKNVAGATEPSYSPLGRVASDGVRVEGHAWGELGPDRNPLATAEAEAARWGRGAYDRVFVCDCLWMPWQHANLQRSIAWFLRPDGRAWVVAGFHTGRAKMRDFFAEDGLRAAGLAVERMWERDCDGVEREWVWDRGIEDVSVRKRWLVVAVLKRIAPDAGAEDQIPGAEEVPK